MGAYIVSRIDGDYGKYAGIDVRCSALIEKIDLIIKFGLLAPEDLALLKLARAHADGMRKVYFATQGCDVVTKLSFLQGIRENVSRATDETNYRIKA
jgi:hypothetical protein